MTYRVLHPYATIILDIPLERVYIKDTSVNMAFDHGLKLL